MAISTQPYKGARDFYPEDKRMQKYLFGVMRNVVEKFGYEEYDAPILEPTELFLLKGNQEIIDEQTYTFTDRGKRSVTIRTEMTPSVSRMVAAKRQELAYPLRWYSIPSLWRYERMQRGRLREFWQLNVDLFGVNNLAAEHEVIIVADGIMQAYGAKRDMYTIRLNSRKLVDSLLRESLQLDEVEAATTIRLIDRMHKMEHADFVAQLDAILSPSEREAGVADRLLRILQVKNIDELPEDLRSHESVKELEELIEMLHAGSVENAVFDITLMRGFDYYTDIVFEVFDTDPNNNRSMFGGGRYDGLVGMFGVDPIPTVGFGMGDVTLHNFLESHNLLPSVKAETEVYVVLIGEATYKKAQAPLHALREMGVKVAVDSSGKKPEKQLKAAAKKGIQYALFIGEKELQDEQYTLKNLETGEEERHSIQRIVTSIKDYRTS